MLFQEINTLKKKKIAKQRHLLHTLVFFPFESVPERKENEAMKGMPGGGWGGCCVRPSGAHCKKGGYEVLLRGTPSPECLQAGAGPKQGGSLSPLHSCHPSPELQLRDSLPEDTQCQLPEGRAEANTQEKGGKK